MRVTGRNARFYMAIASGGSAEPIPFIKGWGIKASSERYDVTAQGDSGKTYVAGLPDAQGDLDGFFDTATNQTYTAARDGVARKIYMYPDIVGSPTKYWFCTGFADWNVSFPTDGPATLTGSWAAASDLIAV